MLSLRSSSLLNCAILLTFTAAMVQSKYVYHRQSHRNIAPHKQVVTWEEAKQLCESEGATLASPISEDLLQHMRTIITVNNHTTAYFIGFKARHNTEFSSEEGILLEDVPEAFDLVEQIDPREGDCMSMDGHSIRVEPCWSRLPFICYTNDTFVDITTEIPNTTPLLCGDNPEYKMYSTGCYKIHLGGENWDEANWTCTTEGAHLVVINDILEAKVVTAIMKDSGEYTSWVGLRKAKGSQDWSAVTGDRVDGLYDIWTEDLNGKPCGYFKLDGKLSDWICEGTCSFVCEI